MVSRALETAVSVTHFAWTASTSVHKSRAYESKFATRNASDYEHQLVRAVLDRADVSQCFSFQPPILFIDYAARFKLS